MRDLVETESYVEMSSCCKTLLCCEHSVSLFWGNTFTEQINEN